MPQNRIIVLIAAGLIVLDLIWFVIRIIKNGLKENDRSKISIARSVMIYITAAALLVVAAFREFGLMGDIIISGCSVLAFEIENRQFLGLIDEEDNMNQYQ